MAADSLPPGVVEHDGERYMRDPKGALVPIEVVRPQYRLEDDTVRRLFERAGMLSGRMADFKEATFADIDAFVAVLADRYEAKAGGAKGNMTLQTFDGLTKIQIQVADRLSFGPELQIAKTLVDQCLKKWSARSKPELKAIVANAFRTDKEGQVNRGALLNLLRLDIEDEVWVRAMTAIRDSIRIEGSTRYLRFYSRAAAQERWRPLSLDMATI